MSVRTRRHAAISLVCALTAGSALLLTACDTAGTTAAPAPSSPAPSSAAPSTAATTPSAAPSAPAVSASVSPVNKTANTGLTISNGTNLVVVNGDTVDFHTVVRDLAWSPDGSRAAFVDGSGNLVVSRPDGSASSVVAKNPGGQTWSHPTWQVVGPHDGLPANNNIFFTIAASGTTHLATVPADTAGSVPTDLRLGSYSDNDAPVLPTAGNTWINGSDRQGTTVYANTAEGDVYIRDDYLRQQGKVLTKGSQPALSTDGESVVFVRSVDGHDHIFTQGTQARQGQAPKDLTPNATTDYTEPAWSRDGKTIAVRTPNGVATLPADGSAAPELVSSVAGLPAYRG
ncbi:MULTISPECIES: LpqB family beta-propeller domain-containing protein [unclassified Kitasatospora]|uniref:LpqB family beta-propeller domain-containing protein n=1 Tax=unclassified Kitasatospora TaxID=2633591 RepID=UPI00070DE705|nr:MULTISPECIES: LpqB family beta-propeller domain-containing protein [unclassified Kitasatospora]KQV24020.1 hypothetical protein ASC99_02120 [Kitasatospora sp. Root107]KRB67266.1 hypothetical protein ASE03_02620 [Kitasatospora sp. Root187]